MAEMNARIEAAGPDAEDAGCLQPLLPLKGDLGHDEVPGIAGDLVIAELNALGP